MNTPSRGAVLLVLGVLVFLLALVQPWRSRDAARRPGAAGLALAAAGVALAAAGTAKLRSSRDRLH
ncbi:MAG: hypothetical protein ACOY3Y_08830 [Acidobacteriota bacterium]